MRIAVWYNLPSGGAKRALHYHIRGLVERGHTVESWCPPSVDQTYLPLGEMIAEHVVPMDWRPNYDRSLLDRLLRPRHDILVGHEVITRHSRVCAQQINAGGFDVFLAHPCQYLCAPPIGRFIQIPSVFYIQEPRRVLFEASPEPPWLGLPSDTPGWWRPAGLLARMESAARIRRVRRDARLEVENADAFDEILVNSLFSREGVLRAYGLDARVCYLGVDTDLFVPQGKPRGDFIVGVGAVAPAKNLHFVIESLALVPPPRPQFVWVGNVSDSRYIEQVKRLAREREVDFTIRMRVSDDELLDLLNTARMMAYAPRLEPFGYAPLEANACELPVVAVAEGGLRETILDGVTGLVVEPDPAAMAQAITRLRDDPAYAAQLGKNGRRVVSERWSVGAAVDRLERRLNERAGIAARPAAIGPSPSAVVARASPQR